jgi:maleamate amidohydrolase
MDISQLGVGGSTDVLCVFRRGAKLKHGRVQVDADAVSAVDCRQSKTESGEIMSDAFSAASYGDIDVGVGERPALLVVDFQKGFCDPHFQMGRSPRIHAARDRTCELIEAARRCNVPVIACTAGWMSEKDMQRWKVSALYRDFFEGGEGVKLDPAIEEAGCDFVFRKCAPSIFFNTPIIPFLTKHRIDTTVVTGCVTSGCIRASVIDSFSYGYRTMVVDECCGDPAEESHVANLQDMSRRYADIKSSAEMAAYFEDTRRRNAS